MADTTSTNKISTGSLISHILLWIVIVLIGGWLVWSATHTTTKNTAFSGQSKQVNNKTTYQRTVYCLLDLFPFSWEGCARQPKESEDAITNKADD